MHDPMTADVDTEVSANEKDQTRVTIVKVSTEGTEKDDRLPTVQADRDWTQLRHYL